MDKVTEEMLVEYLKQAKEIWPHGPEEFDLDQAISIKITSPFLIAPVLDSQGYVVPAIIVPDGENAEILRELTTTEWDRVKKLVENS